MILSKQKVQQGFGKAAHNYDRYAEVQVQIAEHAMTLFRANCCTHKYEFILDVGCGTAWYTQQLKALANNVLHADLSIGMLAQAKQKRPNSHVQYACMDAEALAVQTNSVSAVFSSMALQWLCTPTRFAAECARVLSDNGSASLAILVDGSFSAFFNAWQQLGKPPRLNRFATSTTWLQAFESAGLTAKISHRTFDSLHVSSLAALKSIKQVGADVTHQAATSALKREELKGLDQILMDDTKQVNLNYKVAFFQLTKSGKRA